MNTGKERLRPAPIAQSPMTRVAGVVKLDGGPRPFCMTDRDRAEMLSTALTNDVAGAITRPSGTAADKRRPDPSSTSWDGRQQAAAAELGRLWRTSLRGRSFPMGYGGGHKLGEPDPSEAAVCQDAWNRYCEAMEEVKRRCSARHEQMLRLSVVYEEPVRLDTAWMVREALSFLADHWRLRNR